jgi:hypothetical protein
MVLTTYVANQIFVPIRRGGARAAKFRPCRYSRVAARGFAGLTRLGLPKNAKNMN